MVLDEISRRRAGPFSPAMEIKYVHISAAMMNANLIISFPGNFSFDTVPRGNLAMPARARSMARQFNAPSL
jgi:hypothetical protein